MVLTYPYDYEPLLTSLCLLDLIPPNFSGHELARCTAPQKELILRAPRSLFFPIRLLR